MRLTIKRLTINIAGPIDAEIVQDPQPVPAPQDNCREMRQEIVALRTDLLRATEGAAAMAEELTPLRHVRMLAQIVVSEVAARVPDRSRWSEATRELADALGVTR